MKSIWKKLILIIILVAIIAGIIAIAVNASKGKKEAKVESNSSTTVEKVAKSEESNIAESEITTTVLERQILPTVETKLSDGTKYSITDQEITPEIVVKDNYYDTQISDINLNFEQYEGKTIEIDGFYFENENYTFVGRYSTSNLCPYCPTGYSYFEYEWNGDKQLKLIDSDSWIKVVGTLKKGNDGVDYYYIDAASIEIMNERGLETVSN